MKKVQLTYSLCIVTCIICLFTYSCSSQKKVSMVKNKTKDIASNNGKYIVSAPVVRKDFVKKNGEPTTQKEFYVRRSIQDYYIKFCESNISREDLENHLSTMDTEIKIVTLEIEYLDGHLDICDDNLEQQSRIGAYVIIHRIIK
ncbi:hypothetical protein [Kordia sp.]|uniref:hypothetical protein n=1 Tax=Kordia sp. TaxID=1965332 RepID=UPI003D2B88EC